jgi:hypothetical protein
MDDSPIRLEPRSAAAIGALAIIILVIIFVELCGREDVEPGVQIGEEQPGVSTATLGPTFTPGPSPTGGTVGATESPTPMEGGQDRDAQRAADLQTLQDALELYEGENGTFPNTEDGVQTLCNYVEFDVGCDLLEVVDELPQDPLGDPAVNGYWYRSNGSVYTLYAQLESDAFIECEETPPEFLQDFGKLLCVSGP